MLKRSACRANNADARLQQRVNRRFAAGRGRGVFMRRGSQVAIWVAIAVFAVGCPKDKASHEYQAGRKAEEVKDWDTAVDFYLQAAKADPNNVNVKIRLDQARFEAGQVHVAQGLKLRDKGDLQGAVSQFQRAQILDPSNITADQELKKTLDMIADKARTAAEAEEPLVENGEPVLASRPAEIKPLSRAPINVKMTNESKYVFDTIGKLAGMTIIYDPDLQVRRISVDLTNVTLEQALDIVSLESKTFWKPITENIIMVIPDSTQKRRDYEEQVLRTFYLSNVVIAQDLTEITTGLRQLLELKHIQQVNAQNAIIIRDTPDKLALADKIIKDIDKAKPEVIIQVEVLQARLDKLRNLGITPGQTASVAINPNSTTSNSSTTTSTTSTTTPNTVTLQQLRHLNQSDVVFTLPGATANFVLTDTTTRIIDNPEIRTVDGQQAKLRVGDRVPIATGSFQAGVGVGSTAGAGFVNPLVNTQFQYQDVGVNIDLTPHVHPNRDVSIKLKVEVSSVTGTSTIGGIQQPIISQRTIEHEIRLKEGEVSILGGLIERINTRTLNGWPGLAQIPVMRYLFSGDDTELQENEVLIVVVPRIVRLPEWTRANLRPIYSGTDTLPATRREMDIKAPTANPNPQMTPAGTTTPVQQTPPPGGVPISGVVAPGAVPGAAGGTTPAQVSGPRMRFEPATVNLAPGQTATLGVVVENVNDLFSVPMLLQYNPAVISVEEVRHGGFLSGGTQEIAIVQRVDKEHGQAIISATRQPNTPGVNGSGTLLGIVVKALAPGTSNVSIVQVNAKDSQQKSIPLVTSEATVRVQ